VNSIGIKSISNEPKNINKEINGNLWEKESRSYSSVKNAVSVPVV
jgi:hypothetical protein